MSSNTLVTGAGGFIGRALVERLLMDGASLVATDLDLAPLRASLSVDASRLALYEGDIGDAALQERCLRDVGTVFHLAAAHLSVRSPDSEYRRVNVDAIRSLIERCEEHRIDRFVHLSSVGVFGRIEDPPADEQTVCQPDSIYERTKLEGEQVVLEAVREKNFPAVILRPAWVYGPGDDRTEKLFRAISKGRFVIAGRGDALRHSIFIDDMLGFCLAARDSDAALGQILIVGDEQSVTVRELVGKIAALCEAPSPRRVPLTLLWLLGLGAEVISALVGREPPLSRRTLRFFTGNTSFDTSRARELLGVRPQYDVDRGLSVTHERLGSV